MDNPADAAPNASQSQNVTAAGGKPALTVSSALEHLKAQRAEAEKTNQTSDAARVLAQKSAEAKAARRAAAEAAAGRESEGETEASVETEAEETPGEGRPSDKPTEGPEGEQADDGAAPNEGDDGAQDGDDKTVVELDGVKLTKSEIRHGYLRQADYSRKTQDLAEKRKAVEAKEARFNADYSAKLTQLDNVLHLASLEFENEPDWARIKAEDPVNYPDLFDRHQQRKRKFEALKKVQAEESEKAATDAIVRTVETLGEQIPDWIDPGKRRAGIEAVAQYAVQNGEDPKMVFQKPFYVEVLRKAMLYDKQQAAKAKALQAVKGKPKVQAPGVKPQASVVQSAVKAAWEKFLKNPTTENGAAYQKAKREAAQKGARFQA